jgi:hypothetical protein
MILKAVMRDSIIQHIMRSNQLAYLSLMDLAGLTDVVLTPSATGHTVKKLPRCDNLG